MENQARIFFLREIRDLRVLFAEAPMFTHEQVEEFTSIVDVDGYPVHDPGHPRYKSLLAEFRAGLDQNGCAHGPDFIRPEALEAARAESNELARDAYYSRQSVNPYFTEDDPTLPADHPRRWFMDRTSASRRRVGP